MDALIWELVEGRGRLLPSVTSQLTGTPGRIRAIVSLLYLAGAPDGKNTLIARLNDFQSKSSGLVKIRNRAIHDMWAMRDDGVAHQFCVATDERLDFGLRPRNLTAMGEDFKKVDRHRARFLELKSEISSWLRTLPPTWREQLPFFLS